jgi:uncharacterized phage protein (TIGR02220 family)
MVDNTDGSGMKVSLLVIQEGEVMEGWFKLYRSVLEHRHYRKKRVFNEYEAWLDILLLANYTDKTIDIEGQQVLVKRGTFLTSQKKLADRWDWDKRKVVSFLKDSELHKEITVLTEKRWTVVTVLNYEKYQQKNVEIEIKSVPTFAPTLCTDFPPEIAGVDEVPCTDFMHRSMHTTKEYIKKDKDILSEIIAYLNEVAGTRYRTSVAKTKSLVQARVKEGFTLEDFKTVIDVKCKEWKNDPKMSRYLRPETLFGTKFESYLNQVPKQERNVIPLYQMSKEEKEHYDRLFGNK